MSDQATDPPGAPGFNIYRTDRRVTHARPIPLGVAVRWDDGLESQFHALMLRENSPDPETTHPVTREQAIMLTELPADVCALTAGPDPAGGAWVEWAPEGLVSRYDAGWLRAHAHGAPDRPSDLPPQPTWGREISDRLPRFDGPATLADAGRFAGWLKHIHVDGFAILDDLAAEPGVVAAVARRIGPIRETNFGQVFDVRSKLDADSIAYTAMALPAHSDLCTREYAPGLQLLHAIENEADGGESLLADGFRVAEVLRAEAPDLFRTLTETPIDFANSAQDSDYRHSAPMIALDRDGQLDEIRLSPWLRAPLAAPLPTVDAVYRGLRLYEEIAARLDVQTRFRLPPGSLIAFDNRRILHGRTGFNGASGARWLQGCYVEREELASKLRIAVRRDMVRNLR